METNNLLSENVLSVMQRRQRAINTKRRQPQLKRARQIAARKLAPEETIMKRARRKAKDILRAKYAGKRGANYHTLPPADRVMVDKMIEKKLPAIEKLVKRLLPQVRADERERLKKRKMAKKAGSAATRATKSLVNNKIPLKEMMEVTVDVLVEEFVDFLAEADFDRYSSAVPAHVLEDVIADSLVTTQDQLDEIVNEMSFGYPLMENVNLNPVGGTLVDGKTKYVTLYHPDKMHYHVERIGMDDTDVANQPRIKERLMQGYQIVPTTMDTRNKATGRRYRLKRDDE